MKNYEEQLRQLLIQIPKGKVTTYKELGRAMGTRGYRFVGQLLHKNPYPDKYPCYKVVKSDGSLGGFAKGVAQKDKRLKADGLKIKNNKLVDFKINLYKF